MEQQIESAQAYYNSRRKKSFLVSRLFVIVSMSILIVTLGINLTLLNVNNRTSTNTQASSNNLTATLPPLPTGCNYKNALGKVSVVCNENKENVAVNNDIEENQKEFSIKITLPILPIGCSYQTTNSGLHISCTNPQSVISETPQTLPTNCTLAPTQNEMISCQKAQGKQVFVHLPKLPTECQYKQTATLSVMCSATSVKN